MKNLETKKKERLTAQYTKQFAKILNTEQIALMVKEKIQRDILTFDQKIKKNDEKHHTKFDGTQTK